MSTLTAVPGLTAAHWTHPAGTTGCTVVRVDAGARASHWVPGSAPGSREWGVLEPDHLADAIHAVVLSGGSAFGLATADGVMAALAEEGIGFPLAGNHVPIVPAAILFDLDGGPHRPDAAAGRAAATSASRDPLPHGRVGAGAGARIGRALGAPVPGGWGSFATSFGDHTVGAGVAVNALGGVVHPDTGAPLTHPDMTPTAAASPSPLQHTTLALVATDAPLTRGQCRIVAKMATAALARCLRPAFTPFDGDVVFTLSTTQGPPITDGELLGLGDTAARALATAIIRALPETP